MEITFEKEELYGMIKKAVKEVFQEEKTDFFLNNLPSVSKEEMDDIENEYGKPSGKKEVAYSESIEA